MPRIGPEVLPDVFCGQILSLHPLTWYLFADAALRDVAGRFFASEEYDVISGGQGSQDCPKYWELVGAILTAAHLYQIAHADFENRRGVRQQGGDAVIGIAGDEAPPPVQAFLEAYLAARNIRCTCGSTYSCDEMEPVAEEQQTRQVSLRCTDCGRQNTVEVTEAEIQEYLLDDGDSV